MNTRVRTSIAMLMVSTAMCSSLASAAAPTSFPLTPAAPSGDTMPADRAADPEAATTASPEPTADTPSPRMLSLLQRRHSPDQWLIVHTPEARLRLKADRIGPEGLVGLHGYHAPAPAPALAWPQVTMIEKRESRFRAGQVIGAALGAVALGYLGANVAEANSGPSHSNNDVGALIGVGAGAVLGAWAGGMHGDQMVHTTTLYAAPSSPGDLAAAEIRPHPQINLGRVHGAVRPGDVLRVRGSFGEFAGRVDRIDSAGLQGLHPDPRYDVGGSLPDAIEWSRIATVERRGTSAKRGATVGGLVLGFGVGALTAAIASSWNGAFGSSGSGSDAAGGFLLGGVAGGLVGAGIGAAVGYGIPRWQTVPGVPESTGPEVAVTP